MPLPKRWPSCSSCSNTEFVEHSGRWMPVRQHSQLDLHVPDCVPQIEVEMPLKLPYFISEFCQLTLQRDPLVARQLTIVGRPGRTNRAGAVQTVGQMRHRQCVYVRIVVSLDYDEV